MPGLKLNHVSKRATGCQESRIVVDVLSGMAFKILLENVVKYLFWFKWVSIFRALFIVNCNDNISVWFAANL